jgi:hypothetical protein
VKEPQEPQSTQCKVLIKVDFFDSFGVNEPQRAQSFTP